MKKYFLLLGLIVIALSSCLKTTSTSTTPVSAAQQAKIDSTLINAYIKANNITATADPSGLYYSVITPGTGAYPSASATVTVSYTGSLTSGYIFSPTSTLTSAPLSGLIAGWQIGIPHINDGGTILLLVPSALGYGTVSPGAGIPANSVLVFTITLKSFVD